MVSPTGGNDAGSSGDAISFQLQSRNLPSKRLLGKGLSGFGYETIVDGKRYARKDFVGVSSDIFVQEAAVLVGLKDHKNIVKTYGWTVDKRSCSLLLEYMDDDLLSLLQKKREFKQDLAGTGFGYEASTSTSTQSIGDQSSASTSSQPFELLERLDIISQLAMGMEYLHQQGIAHGDLKTKNILVTYMKDGDRTFKVVKVTDFGLVQTKRKSKPIVSRQVRKLNIVKWKAPEYLKIYFRRLKVINAKDETSSESNSNSESEETSTPVVRIDVFAADVYSFAVTCSQILTGKDPYPNLDWRDLRDKILSGLRPNLPDSCPLLLRNLLISCWGDPVQRPTFSKIHKWLQEHRDELLTAGACNEPVANDYPIQPTNEHISVKTDIERPIPSNSIMNTWLLPCLSSLSMTKGSSEVDYPSALVPVQTLVQRYLELSTECMDRVSSMIESSTSLKFNKEQCDYLANKLKRAVSSAKVFVGLLGTWNNEFDSTEDRAWSLEIFKLLFALGKEVESLTRSCCRDEAAIMLVNVSEYITLIGFNLAICTIILSSDKEFESLKIKDFEGAEVWDAEAEIVRRIAILDELRLFEDVKFMIKSSKKSSPKLQLVTFLFESLERQKQERQRPGSALEGSDQFSRPEYLGKNLKQRMRLALSLRVFKAVWLGVDVAMKTFASNLDFENEVKILQGLHHPNIVPLLWFVRNEDTCYTIMELMDGDLDFLIRDRMQRDYLDSPFNIFEALHIMLQVAQGMLYVHQKKIVHGNLNSRSILINYNWKVDVEVESFEIVHVKIAGFGFPRKEKSNIMWMAPEMINIDNYDDQTKLSEAKGSLKYPFKVDIYSFGMLCFEILTGCVPFSTLRPREVVKQVLTGAHPRLPDECPDKLRSVIEACWNQNPSERPNFHDICVELRNLKTALLIESASVWMQSPERRARLPTKVWTVGLDFGTIFSGFAYAKASAPEDISLYYNWPSRTCETSYCKTLTGLFYKPTGSGELECASWGHIARSEFMASRGGKAEAANLPQGFYFSKFKLRLKRDLNDPELEWSIPEPLTVHLIIVDYFRNIGKFALSVIRSHEGNADLTSDSVQWCVTVPSIWDENVKQQMRTCMVDAGLVSAAAGGIDAVKVVLEPEAASFHCLQILRKEHKDIIKVKDKILVADVGGASVDIVLQELIATGRSYKVRELTQSSGGLCGGTFVDESFIRFLSKKIPCLDEFLQDDFPYKTRLLKDWEDLKCAFGHETMSHNDTKEIILHHKLARTWEEYETVQLGRPHRGSYFEVELTQQDMKAIFDPVVDQILELVAAQLMQVSGVKFMFVVGGFASSPYLLRRIRTRFSGEVLHIVSPPNPGSAICQGAVLLARNPDAILSRHKL